MPPQNSTLVPSAGINFRLCGQANSPSPANILKFQAAIKIARQRLANTISQISQRAPLSAEQQLALE